MPRLKSAPTRLQSAPQRLSEANGSWRAGKGSSAARGYDYRWQKARLRHLEKYPLCVKCEELGIVTAANTVDHDIPHRGDQVLFWDESNWRSMCTPHHSGDKQREEAAAQR